MGKRAFVTGGTGFFGTNLIRELNNQGWKSIVFHRKGSNTSRLKGLNVEFREGSLFEPEGLAAAMPEDVDAVFHVAGLVSFWPGNRRIQYQTNVVGTRNVVEAALRRKAKRFIHTSSVAAYGMVDQRVDESFPRNGIKSNFGYFKTKALGELEVLKGVDRGLSAVILNPAHIIGPFDTVNWGRTFRMMKDGKVPGAPSGAGSFVHAVEAAKAHVAAVERGKIGANYILAGTDASFFELFRLIEELLGLPPHIKPVPVFLLKLVGWAGLLGSLFTRREPDLTPQMVSLFSKKYFYCSTLAQKELNLQIRTLREMLEDSYRWLIAEKLLPQSKP